MSLTPGSALLPMITYIVVTSYTPGPNNITATTAGAKIGLRRTIPYLLGIASGFFMIMLMSGFFNLFLKTSYSSVAGYVKWLGFLYMVWLAVSLFFHGKDTQEPATRFTFTTGFLLQLINPKAILYGITLFGTFSERLATGPSRILLSSTVLAVVGFSSIFAWCLAGTLFTRFLGSPKRQLAFNILMAGLLLYSAISIVLE